jgi:hypothetical protein
MQPLIEKPPLPTHGLGSAVSRTWLGLAVLFLGVTFAPAPARAQFVTGTGGATGTTTPTGTLAATDLFLSVQKTEGVNLNARDLANFMNLASCECQRPVWLKAILNSSAVTTSSTVSPTAIVSLYLGTNCNSDLITRNACRQIGNAIAFSQFRLSGITAETTVDVVETGFGAFTSTGVLVTGTGGVAGTGGISGSGGDFGTGGNSGTGGTIGAIQVPTCGNLGTSSQTLFVFVENSLGAEDIVTATMAIPVDTLPPPPPTNVGIQPANEALLLNWTAVDQTAVPDLYGYQIFCTRADQFQVFNSGAFSTFIDSCNDTATLASPTAIADLNTNFLCSPTLGTSATSTRVKILQNGIWYYVGVSAIDNHGNASPAAFPPAGGDRPVPTIDFYETYREGDPQGGATGGYCAVAPGRGKSRAAIAGGAAGLIGLALVIARRRRPRRPRRRA